MPRNNGDADPSRLDRIERTLEALASEDVRLGGRLDQLVGIVERLTAVVERETEAQKHTEERLNALTALMERQAEAQKHTDERLNALITVVDDIVRRRPPQ